MKTSRSLIGRTAALATSAILATATATVLHAQQNAVSAAEMLDVAITGSSPSGIGVHGSSNSPTGTGVLGQAFATSGDTVGVVAQVFSTSGSAVQAISNASSGFTTGVYALNASATGTGVYAYSLGTGVEAEGIYGDGVVGTTLSASGHGVSGYSINLNGSTYGVYGESHSSSGVGVYGLAHGSSAYGLYGRATGQFGKGLYTVVTSSHSSANAILAQSGGGDSYAAYLIGRVRVTGALSVGDVPVGDFANMQYNTATGQLFYDNSSKRNKENIQPLDADFAAILQAEPVQYTRPAAPERLEIGYIAEDMETLGLDRLIGYNADGQVETFNYEKMIVYVVEVLKDQQQTIEQLQAEVARLSSRK